ncbi:hypothetical protein QR680_015211 [Steinernema hermaphroditum]|uniref:C2H2-type domain-containing protein n=1 Tax=Steinernema hermaphroditum TaxID=289476 RepID=A0AA39M4J4_9BILA|nr:hypothetical protein QR680_015211 [Steinernema hermaphroditum]
MDSSADEVMRDGSVSEEENEAMEVVEEEAEDEEVNDRESCLSRKRKHSEEPSNGLFKIAENGELQMCLEIDRSSLNFKEDELPTKSTVLDAEEQWPPILDLLIHRAVRVAPLGFQYFIAQCSQDIYENFVGKLQPKFKGHLSKQSSLAILFILYEVWNTLTREEQKEWDKHAVEKIYPDGVPKKVKTFGNAQDVAWLESVSVEQLPCLLCSPGDESRYNYKRLLAHITYSHSFLQMHACQHCGQAYEQEEHLYTESHCRDFRVSATERRPFLAAVCTLVCVECGFQYVMSASADEKKCAEEYLSVLLSHNHAQFTVFRTLSHEPIKVNRAKFTFMSRKGLMPGSCQTCGVQFSTIVEGRKHFEKKHPPEMERLKCSKCPFSTCNKQALRDHVIGSHLTKWNLKEAMEHLTLHPPAHCEEPTQTSPYTAQLREEFAKAEYHGDTNVPVHNNIKVRLSNAVIEATAVGSNRFDTLTLSARKEYRHEVQINVSIESPFRDTMHGTILNNDVYYCYSCSTIFLGENKLEQHQQTCDTKKANRQPLKKEGAIKLLASPLFSANRTLRCPLCPRVRCCSIVSLRRHMINTHDKFAHFNATLLTLDKYVKDWIAGQASGLMHEFASTFHGLLEAVGAVSEDEEPEEKRSRSNRIQVFQSYVGDSVEEDQDVENMPSRLIACDEVGNYCHFCKEAYSTSAALRDHLKRKHAFICPDCKGLFMDEKFYNVHKCDGTTKKILAVNCAVCNHQLKSTEAFYNHILDSHFENVHFCPRTGQLFPRIVDKCIKEDTPNLICSLCALPDFRACELATHMKNHTEKWDRCPLCKILSPDKPCTKEGVDVSTNNLFHHIYQEHCPLNAGGIRSCYFCSRTIPQVIRKSLNMEVSQLIRHLIFECDPCNYCLLCNDAVPLTESIREHRIKKHSNVFQRFKCPVCRTKFRTYAAYRGHKMYDECSQEIANGNCIVEDENFLITGKTKLAKTMRPKPILAAENQSQDIVEPLTEDSDDDDIFVDEEAAAEADIEREVRNVIDGLLDSVCGPVEDIQVVDVRSVESSSVDDDAIEIIDDDLAVVGEGKGLTTQRKEQTIQCPKCSARFQKQFSLDLHMKEHINDCGETIDDVFGVPRNKPVFICRSCCLAYEDQRVYGRHRERHGHVFSCSQCNAINSHRNVIQEHYDMHSAEKGQKRLVFGCSTCSIGFHSNEGFCHHMRNEHEHDLLFFCKNCGFGHTNADRCVEHIYAAKCMHNDSVQSVLGVCMASIFHYQPQNVEDHRTSIEMYPNTAVTPSDCTHRSFSATNECMVSCPECAVLIPYSTYYHMGYVKDAQTLRICPTDNTTPLYYTKTHFVKNPKLRERLARDDSGTSTPRPLPQHRSGLPPVGSASRTTPGMRVITPTTPSSMVNRRIGSASVVLPRNAGTARSSGPPPVIIRHNPHAVVAQQRAQARSLYSINNTRQVINPTRNPVRYHIGSAPSSSGLSPLNARTSGLMTMRRPTTVVRNQAFENIGRSMASENDKTGVEFPVDPSGALRCPYTGCDATFLTRSQGVIHRIRHIQHKYVCMECGRAQITEKDAVIHQFKQHVKRFSSKDVEYRLTCPCCLRVFLSLPQFSQHLCEADHEGLRYEEESCFRKFGSQSLARHHTLVHQLFKRGKGNCTRPQCCALCATIEKYWEHQLTDSFTLNHTHIHGFHQVGLCRCCGAQFPVNDATSFQGHFRSHHCKKIVHIDAYICHCGEQVQSKDLTSHFNEKHYVLGLRFNPVPGNGKLLIETNESFRRCFGIEQS